MYQVALALRGLLFFKCPRTVKFALFANTLNVCLYAEKCVSVSTCSTSKGLHVLKYILPKKILTPNESDLGE